MDGRERYLTVIANEKPDRLPCQVHNWMAYYLNHYLDGDDVFAAYARFGMDPVIYTGPIPHYRMEDLERWVAARKDLGLDADGVRHWVETVETPKGVLTRRLASNEFTTWATEFLIKSEDDFAIWNEFVPLPVKFDWSPVRDAKARVGRHGIVRGVVHGYGQCSPWQDFCCLMDTQDAIYAAMDKPEWVHHALSSILDKRLRTIEVMGTLEWDLTECGGGAGSSTVISPRLFEEFLLPYDRRQIEAIHQAGSRVVYHLCGGLMPMLELVAATGADGLETMTPPSMGGDCDLAEATRRVGDRLFFIGGFDQNAGFERGNPETVRRLVRECHAACPDGGYICCPSDHFFFGDPENLRAFVDAARECVY